jgi:hypothetical protein
VRHIGRQDYLTSLWDGAVCGRTDSDGDRQGSCLPKQSSWTVGTQLSRGSNELDQMFEMQ